VEPSKCPESKTELPLTMEELPYQHIKFIDMCICFAVDFMFSSAMMRGHRLFDNASVIMGVWLPVRPRALVCVCLCNDVCESIRIYVRVWASLYVSCLRASACMRIYIYIYIYIYIRVCVCVFWLYFHSPVTCFRAAVLENVSGVRIISIFMFSMYRRGRSLTYQTQKLPDII